MRPRLRYTAAALFLLALTTPTRAQSAEVDRREVITLIKQIWAAGSWDQQRAAFERLREPERSAVRTALIDVRPAAVRTSSDDGPTELGPCQEVHECSYGAAPKPMPPQVAPGSSPSRPPVVTPPVKYCTNQTAYAPYEIASEPGMTAFVYAANLFWCFHSPVSTQPLSDYSSYSYAPDCCMFPWGTDPGRYIDVLTPLPAATPRQLFDHHTGYFEARASAGGFEAGVTHTPNIDATVLADGTYSRA